MNKFIRVTSILLPCLFNTQSYATQKHSLRVLESSSILTSKFNGSISGLFPREARSLVSSTTPQRRFFHSFSQETALYRGSIAALLTSGRTDVVRGVKFKVGDIVTPKTDSCVDSTSAHFYISAPDVTISDMLHMLLKCENLERLLLVQPSGITKKSIEVAFESIKKLPSGKRDKIKKIDFISPLGTDSIKYLANNIAQIIADNPSRNLSFTLQQRHFNNYPESVNQLLNEFSIESLIYMLTDRKKNLDPNFEPVPFLTFNILADENEDVLEMRYKMAHIMKNYPCLSANVIPQKDYEEVSRHIRKESKELEIK